MGEHSQMKTSASHTARARSAWQMLVQTPTDPRCEHVHLVASYSNPQQVGRRAIHGRTVSGADNITRDL